MRGLLLLFSFILMPSLANAACIRAGETILPLGTSDLCLDFNRKDRSAQTFRIQGNASWISLRLEALPGKAGTLAIYRVKNGASAGKALWRGRLDPSAGTGGEEGMVLQAGDYTAVFEDTDSVRLRAHFTVQPLKEAAGNPTDAVTMSLPPGSKSSWTVTPEGAGQLWDLMLATPLGYGTAWLRLDGPDGFSLSLRGGGEGGVTGKADLSLPPGRYTLTVKDQPEVAVAFKASPSQLKAAAAAEPDDTSVDAHLLSPGSRVEGRLFQPGGNPDRDRFRFSVEPRTVVAISIGHPAGGNLSAMLEDQSGKVLLRLSDSETVTSGNASSLRSGRLALPGGSYALTLEGRLPQSSLYTVLLEPQAPGAADEEAEPNGLVAYATPLVPGRSLRGTLTPGDRDLLRLDVPKGSRDAWTITAIGQGPYQLSYLTPEGDVVQTVRRADAGALSLARLPLAPGLHYFRLEGKGRWQAVATSTEPPAEGDEVESNDSAESATPLIPGRPVRFWMESPGALDQFLLPLAAASAVELSVHLPPGVEADARWIILGGPKKGLPLSFEPTGAHPDMQAIWAGTLPAGRHRLVLTAKRGATGPGEIRVVSGPPSGTTSAPAGVQRKTVTLAGGYPLGQTIVLSLDGLSPPASSSVWIAAPGFTSEWTPKGLAIHAPPYLPDGLSVPVMVSPAGQATRLEIRLVVDRNAAPLEPSDMNGLPSSLAGGMNYALFGLGARTQEKEQSGLFALGYDGRPIHIPAKGVEVELAGQLPIDVKGIVLTPPAAGEQGERVRQFRIEARLGDGPFKPVLTGEAEAWPVPQAFVFPQPVQAHALRLVPLGRWDGESGEATLSRWAAIGATGQIAGPIDLARPELGGHLVLAPPADEILLGTEREWPGKATRLLPNEGDSAWVMAFSENRAARLSSLAVTWPAADPTRQIGTIRIEASAAGPLGPWSFAGEVTPQSAALALDPDHAVAALRFTPDRPAKGVGLAFPAKISVIESPGPSILSLPRDGPVTVHSPPPAVNQQAVPEGRSYMAPLAPRQARTIRLQAENPADGASRMLEIDGHLRGLDLSLTDAHGQPIPMVTGSTGNASFIADATGREAPYNLTIQRRATALAVVWDTSSSVDPFQQAITTSVRNLVGHLGETGSSIGAINLVPFGAPEPLLKHFTDDPAVARGALHAFHPAAQSSDAEKALVMTLRAFRDTTLEPAVILLTDGDFPSRNSRAAWEEIARVRPRIFTLRIPASASSESEKLLGDWSSATDGSQDLVADGWDTVEAFREIEERLNAPRPVKVAWRVTDTPAEPGRLSVVSGGTGMASGRAARAKRPVLVVLDASGSMLGRIGGKRKIEMAKTLLDGLVDGIGAQDAPMGLRVFGLGSRDSCETQLLLPVAKSTSGEARAKVARILPQDGAKTAIAASLSRVTGDLKDNPHGTVILITDGEETCGGDPEKEIRALQKAGLDVAVNIIGFDLADAALRARFDAWAHLGQGAYFDARDESGLQAAMDKALAPRFVVIGPDGNVAGAGTVGGGTLTLPAGHYSLRMEGKPDTSAIPLVVAAGEVTTLRVDQTLLPLSP